MSKENAIIIGVAVGAVVVGGGVWFWRKRRAKKNAVATTAVMNNSTPQERTIIVQTVTATKEEPVPVVTTPVEIEVKDDVPVVEEPVKEEVEPEVEDELAQALKHNAKAAADVVQTARVGNEEIQCVSRIRVPDNSNAPLFWNAMIRKIRRLEVINVTQDDFVLKDKEFPRGYHRCTLDGSMSGILHVTKNNYSAVFIDSTGEFYGISTSANRFGGRTLCNITADRARTFLNGN